MNKLQITLILIIICFANTANSQQWGLYTLYATKNGTQAFLIDTATTPVTYKTWNFTSSKKSVYSTYLIPGDTLVRSYKPTANTSWNTGPCHGGIQKIAWDGMVTWDYTYYLANSYCLHHDICPMPNGNVLMICYEVKTAAQAIQAGCSSSSVIYSEKIIEVKPTGATTGTIVWEWHLWDHLCQNYSSAKDNYVTSIVNNPQLLNINYSGTGSFPDKYHMNGIDFNQKLNQIVVSMHFMNSVFVIDHSTTTAEAAGHTGGNSGKGGDFLYRWGNPASYGATGTAFFNVVHDAHWVPSDNPNYPNYLCGFNNNTPSNSKIEIWNPPYDGNNYSRTPGSAYGPSTYNYQYNATFAAQNEGNSQQLPNGNMLVNNSFGAVYEVNSAGTILWTKAGTNSTHAYRFTKCYVRGPHAKASASTATICKGVTVTLNSSATSITETNPTYTYLWSTGQNIQNPSVTPDSNTTYKVIITNTDLGCSDSAFVTVTVGSIPIPTITKNGNILTSSSAVSYQWYENDSLLNGETAQSFTPSKNGKYRVEITDVNGCKSKSALFDYYITALANSNISNNIEIFPNPASDEVELKGDFLSNCNYEILLLNSYGQIQKQQKNIKIIDLLSLRNGMYIVLVKIENSETIYKKLVISK
jgi:hypothetical protein